MSKLSLLLRELSTAKRGLCRCEDTLHLAQKNRLRNRKRNSPVTRNQRLNLAKTQDMGRVKELEEPDKTSPGWVRERCPVLRLHEIRRRHLCSPPLQGHQ